MTSDDVNMVEEQNPSGLTPAKKQNVKKEKTKPQEVKKEEEPVHEKVRDSLVFGSECLILDNR